jgi:hypothetical protein
MQVDAPSRPPPPPPPEAAPPPVSAFSSQAPTTRAPPPIHGPGHRRTHVSFDMSLNSNLTRLDLRGNTSHKDAAQWSKQTIGELQNIGSHGSASYQQPPTQQAPMARPQEAPRPPEQLPTHESTSPSTPKYIKRHGWYNGHSPHVPHGGQVARTSPEDSSSSDGVATPSASAPESHPTIVHSNGDIERHHSHLSADASQNVGNPCIPS